MIEWLGDNPWTAFFILAIGLTLVENFIKRLTGCKDKESLLVKAYYETKKLELEIKNLQSTIAELRRQRDRERMNEAHRGTWEAYQRQRDFNAREEAFRKQNDYNRRHKATNDKADYEAKQRTNLTWSEIKQKYREDMKRLHPDKVKARGGSEAEIAKATKQTQELNRLYNEAKKRYGK